MFNFKKFWVKDVEQWRQVKTLTLASTVSTHGGGKSDATTYVHLFESDKNNRTMRVGVSASGISETQLVDFVKTTDLYHTRIFRWLNGRIDPDIPRYDQIPEEETVAMLKGSIE